MDRYLGPNIMELFRVQQPVLVPKVLMGRPLHFYEETWKCFGKCQGYQRWRNWQSPSSIGMQGFRSAKGDIDFKQWPWPPKSSGLLRNPQAPGGISPASFAGARVDTNRSSNPNCSKSSEILSLKP